MSYYIAGSLLENIHFYLFCFRGFDCGLSSSNQSCKIVSYQCQKNLSLMFTKKQRHYHTKQTQLCT